MFSKNILLVSALIILAVFVAIFVIVVILDIKKAKRLQQKYTWKRTLTALLFLLPACILAYFFVLLPIIYSLAYSFTNYKLLKPNQIEFIGFDNFILAFKEMFNKDQKLSRAVLNTLYFVVLVVPLQIGLALLLALFCNAKMKGNTIFKVCFFTPVVISLSVTSYLWKQILSPSESGMFNSILGLFNIPAKDLLNDPKPTMPTIVFISAWQGCGYQMLIFLSALTGIRKDLYEAARLDGCNAWHRFWKVTVPGLRPTVLYVLVTVFIGACRIMVQPMLMVGYHDNSVTLSYFMYEQGFSNQLVGYSSAIALLMTIIVGTITLLQRKLLGGKK